MLVSFISAAASGASIISLVTLPNLPYLARIAIGGLALLATIYLIYSSIKNNNTNERICRSEDEIKAAMKEIISMQGKVCVVSRDLSWVDDEVEACIIRKANEGMHIFVERQTDLTKRLEERGVKMDYYGDFSFEPKTRFTIIRHNTPNTQVAIANTQNSVRKRGSVKHVIYQTSNNKNKQDAWINSLAKDMVNLLSSVCKERKNV